MVDDDDLANECLCDRRRVVSVAHNFPSTNLILGKIISKPTTGGNEINLGNIIADSLQQSLQFLPGFLVTLFSILDSLVVHLIDGYNQLLNAEGPCEVRVFPRLASRSNGYFELSLLCRNYEYSNIRLAGPRDHVLDEVAVSRRIDNPVEVMRSLEFLE